MGCEKYGGDAERDAITRDVVELLQGSPIAARR